MRALARFHATERVENPLLFAVSRTATILTLVLAGAVLSEPAVAASVTVGFEEPIPQAPRTAGKRSEYREAGLVFREAPRPGEFPNGMTRTGDDFGSSLRFLIGSSLVFHMDDGSAFDLISMDLAEYSARFQEPREIPVFGERSDGTIVESRFVTDGLTDGFGPLPDFETFSLPSAFVGLVEVRMPVDLFSIDNVVVGVVPEPAAGTYLGLGLLSSLLLGRKARPGEVSVAARSNR